VSSDSAAELRAVIDRQLRDLTSWVVVVHQAIADRLGLGMSDLKALDLAARGGTQVTAGRIAETTGLSSSSVTALLDRLEREGFIERRRDGSDRRRVVVVTTGKREREVMRAFEPLQRASREVLAGYDRAGLELITGFLGRLDLVMADIAARTETRT
jgi:DNA-binding MarR family transcriptional regulator